MRHDAQDNFCFSWHWCDNREDASDRYRENAFAQVGALHNRSRPPEYRQTEWGLWISRMLPRHCHCSRRWARAGGKQTLMLLQAARLKMRRADAWRKNDPLHPG